MKPEFTDHKLGTTSHHIEELMERFHQTCSEMGESEQRVMKRLTQRLHVSRNVSRQFEEHLTFGQRLADHIAAFVGSWVFILLFVALLLAWVTLNTFILAKLGKAFDLYPYILLNLFLSMVAALQAPLIMMSQNRQAAKDRLEAEHDYEVNLKAELEILGLHQKIDTLREEQWVELVSMQQEQIRLLTTLQQSTEGSAGVVSSRKVTRKRKLWNQPRAETTQRPPSGSGSVAIRAAIRRWGQRRIPSKRVRLHSHSAHCGNL
jgi:uncharacterized membrane protein